MDTSMSMILIGICMIVFIMIAFKKQVGYIVKFLIRGAIGVVGFSMVNLLAGTTFVGVNLISICVVGLLGIPGFVSLYIIKLIV